MAAPYHAILSKNDRALMAYLISKSAGTSDDTYPAKRSRDKALPHTICWSEKAVENPPFSGVYDITVSILVKCQAAEDSDQDGQARIDSDHRTAMVFDAFHIGLDSSGYALAEAITAAARALAASDPQNHGDLVDYTMQDIMDKGPEAAFDEEGIWTETLNLLCVACPANVS